MGTDLRLHGEPVPDLQFEMISRLTKKANNNVSSQLKTIEEKALIRREPALEKVDYTHLSRGLRSESKILQMTLS